MTTIPYLKIADVLRRQISDGALAPGTRLPSTRELARVHGVALATAAHALRTLASEGLVKPIPRVGNVVTGARLSPTAGRAKRTGDRTREEIVRASIAIADREGLAALSIRGVAARVDLPTMTVYQYVRSKEELIALMSESALSEEPLPMPPPRGFRAQLELATRAEWRLFRKHPWLARALNLTRPKATPSTLAFADWMMRALSGLGLSAHERMRIHLLLHSYVQGLSVNLETEAQLAGESGVSEAEWMLGAEAGFAEEAASGRYPHFAELLVDLKEGFELDLDQLFEHGLALMLDGLQKRLSKRTRR